MLPAFTTSVRCGEPQLEKLSEFWHQLGSEDRAVLYRFAEFLVSSQANPHNATNTTTSFPDPESFVRPAEESVIKAIKRLTATYPMINKDKLLHQTSDLMAGHVVKGRGATEVIDDLEVLFAEHYQQLKNEFEQNC